MVRAHVGCALLALLLPRPASPQDRLASTVPTRPVQHVDSAAVLREARSAQASFERFRYRHFPIARSMAPTHRCDEQVGRFCFLLDDEDEREPPPEPQPVAGRRAELVTALDRTAAVLPGDPWIAGQRVRYLVEAGQADRAATAARECRAEPWWCSALQGYALHDGGRYAESEAAFTRAVEAMPADLREQWTADLRLLLPADGARLLRRTDAGERDRLVRRLWWLADPLWSEPGNDRWTEHGARWVFDRLQARARSTEDTAWGVDSRELLLRYGRHVWWERYPLGASMWADDGVISYVKPRTREFLPPLSVAADPSTLKGTEWERGAEPDATRYAPVYAYRFMDLPHDVAIFRRGTQAELVAAYAMEPDSLPARPRIRAAVVAMADADGAPAIARAASDRPSGALRLRLPPGTTVLSVEVREDSSRMVGRWRQALEVKPGEHVSDLLLLSDAQARPTTLDEAAPLARGSGTISPGETVGVYWEMYDLPAGADSATVGVQLIPGQAGWARRQLESVGLARAGQPVRMRWSEALDAGPIVGRSLGVRLPPDLRPGDYVLEVEVRVPGREPARIRRDLSVTRPKP